MAPTVTDLTIDAAYPANPSSDALSAPRRALGLGPLETRSPSVSEGLSPGAHGTDPVQLPWGSPQRAADGWPTRPSATAHRSAALSPASSAAAVESVRLPGGRTAWTLDQAGRAAARGRALAAQLAASLQWGGGVSGGLGSLTSTPGSPGGPSALSVTLLCILLGLASRSIYAANARPPTGIVPAVPVPPGRPLSS
jgi:hypothetical protein